MQNPRKPSFESSFKPYLAEMTQSLKTLSKTEKEREITEIQTHLESAGEEYVSQGMSESDATERAIKEFGTPKYVARKLIHMIWRARLKNMPQTFLGSVVLSMLLTYITLHLCGKVMIYLVMYLSSSVRMTNINLFNNINLVIVIYIIFYFMSLLLIGYLAGIFLPKHAWRSTIIAYAVPFSLLCLTNLGILYWRETSLTISTFSCLVILWLVLPLKRYIRALLALTPIALVYLCFKYCGDGFDKESISHREAITDPAKVFIWEIVNPSILICCLVVAGFIIVATSIGVWLGRWQVKTRQRRRLQRA